MIAGARAAIRAAVSDALNHGARTPEEIAEEVADVLTFHGWTIVASEVKNTRSSAA